MEEQQVKEILNKYKRIADLYRKDLEEVIINNANLQETKIIVNYLDNKLILVRKKIFRRNCQLTWMTLTFVVLLYLVLYLINPKIFEYEFLILALPVLSLAWVFLSPNRERSLEQEELSLEFFKNELIN